ncbi:MAG: glycoside hydrolase family 3 C-terminal domain-containing protein [Acidobacteriota bacterium]
MLATATAIPAHAQQSSPLYLDPAQPVEARVSDLMRRMTLKEKIGQLNLPCGYVDELGKTPDEQAAAARQFVAGTYTSTIGPGSGFFTLANTLKDPDLARQVALFNELQRIATTQTRLKIPLLEDEEGTHGAMFPGATVFPEGLAIGSTFDPPLVQRLYAAAAEEARAVGIHILSTLVLELDRDPRMGRNMEAYTEDPYLDAQIAKAIVTGAQGDNIAAPDRTVALMTDFPTQSQPAGGMERGAIDLSGRSLRETALVPWIAAFQAGALGVMAGYPEIDDIPEHASEKWNTEILRNELGFRGIVVSEGGGFASLIYENVAADQKQAGIEALRAGVDMDITYEPAYMAPLIESVQSGAIPESLVDRAVRRVLELKFRLGLFDHPYADLAHAQLVVHSTEHRQLALQAAREGIVLLKNDNQILPLKKDLQTIAVIGPNANDGWSQLGDYSPSVVPQKVTTVLDGIKAAVPAANVLYAQGCDVIAGKEDFSPAIAAARKAQVAIVVVGERPDNTGRGDATATDGEAFDVAGLNLTGAQEDLVKAIHATGTPVVLVLINGRPLSIPWEAAHMPAIVEAWEPGEAGGEAIADVLFGDYNPTGRLAISIPRSSGQLPDYYDYKPSKEYWMTQGWSHDGGYVDMPAAPLWSFGDGLSYSAFFYSHLRVDLPRSGSLPATVTVNVTNTGSRAATDTVQLYLHQRVAPVSLPVRQLRGFARVTLAPGQTQPVTFTIRPEDLMFLDRDMKWRMVPGTVDILIGGASDHIVLRGSLDVKPPAALTAGSPTQPNLAR